MTDSSSEFDQQTYAELHDELMAEFSYETEAWVAERLDRVITRLNAVRADGVPCRLAERHP